MHLFLHSYQCSDSGIGYYVKGYCVKGHVVYNSRYVGIPSNFILSPHLLFCVLFVLNWNVDAKRQILM